MKLVLDKLTKQRKRKLKFEIFDPLRMVTVSSVVYVEGIASRMSIMDRKITSSLLGKQLSEY